MVRFLAAARTEHNNAYPSRSETAWCWLAARLDDRRLQTFRISLACAPTAGDTMRPPGEQNAIVTIAGVLTDYAGLASLFTDKIVISKMPGVFVPGPGRLRAKPACHLPRWTCAEPGIAIRRRGAPGRQPLGANPRCLIERPPCRCIVVYRRRAVNRVGARAGAADITPEMVERGKRATAMVEVTARSVT